MSRETVDRKAARLLVEGRVVLIQVDFDRIVGEVRGDHDWHRVRLDPSGWSCSCAHPAPACSHIEAVARVTTARRGEGRPPARNYRTSPERFATDWTRPSERLRLVTDDAS